MSTERAIVRRPSDTYAASSSLITFTLAFFPDVALLANLRWCPIGQDQMMAQLCTSNKLDVVSGDRSEVVRRVNQAAESASPPREEILLKTFIEEVIGTRDALDSSSLILWCR
ncbi:hypothetical protein BDN71DRAFT_1439000 [Pleurotus eryngii]|uniref:Uncharacterized protein n=1 Tax=Pleurotus eryngii TaxID=5323 RepID=A0A9P6DK53_PLEER|nr:hypothetical protein BDN71DRAFT_1439000 [Pleurotus eryngii]